MLLHFMLIQNRSFFSTVYQRMQEGGMVFMTTIMVLFIITVLMIIKSCIQLKKESLVTTKNIKLINSIGLLALIFGVFSQLLGFIYALDHFEFLNGASPATLAGGLKTTFLPTLFGTLTLIISRVSTTILVFLQKEEFEKE